MATGLILILTTALLAADDGPFLSIANGLLEARYNRKTEDVALVHLASRQVFFRGRLTEGQVRDVKIRGLVDPTFGQGKAMEVLYQDGHLDTLMAFDGLAFILVRPGACNDGNEPRSIRSVKAFDGVVDLGLAGQRPITLGTGGLLAADKNPGSYMWLAIAVPGLRRGVVAGWITCDRGSGVIFSGIEASLVRLTAQIDYGRLRLAPGQGEQLEVLAIGMFEDARLGLEGWADAVARYYKIRLPRQPVGFCTWYSRPYGRASDQEHITQQAAFAARCLGPFGFSVIQIDDGWQAGVSKDGPRRNFTTHDPNGPYPAGMKQAADRIKSYGLVPGIWFMPFAGTSYDPFFADHQDWFVKRASDGSPYQTRWGGTCLDMTNPGARGYLESVVQRIAHQWGFGYFKMDGLWTGTGTPQQYVNSGYKDDGMGDAVFHDPNKTNIEAFRDGLRLVRQTAGPGVFILGCNGPQNMRSYGGAFGLVDAMRIGPDNGPEWSRLIRGPLFGSRHYFLHGRIWYNDPDPVYVRQSVPIEHARLICSWVTISGQLNMCSEWLPGLPEDRLDLLKRTMPSHGLHARPVDLFENEPPRVWLLSDTRGPVRRDVIGLFNWSDRQMSIAEPLDRIGLDQNANYLAFEYWQDRMIRPIHGRLEVEVPGQSCMVIAVRKDAGVPVLISTSRHITQGMVDVIEERWDPTSRSLEGRSMVVGGDPYELRVAGPKARDVQVSTDDLQAGAKVELRYEEGLNRVVIHPPVSGEVKWMLRF